MIKSTRKEKAVKSRNEGNKASGRYGSIWATLGLPKKFTPWSFESFSHFFLDFSKKKAKIFEI